MRKSVADVKHAIEEQLIPMINERQHMMDQARVSAASSVLASSADNLIQALEESDILVLSAGKFEVSCRIINFVLFISKPRETSSERNHHQFCGAFDNL